MYFFDWQLGINIFQLENNIFSPQFLCLIEYYENHSFVFIPCALVIVTYVCLVEIFAKLSILHSLHTFYFLHHLLLHWKDFQQMIRRSPSSRWWSTKHCRWRAVYLHLTFSPQHFSICTGTLSCGFLHFK